MKRKLSDTGNQLINEENGSSLSKNIGPNKLLKGIELSEKIRDKVEQIFAFTKKSVVVILMAFSIVTHQESQAADSLIGEKWESTAEYKKYLELGGEKSPEAKKLKEETMVKVTKEILSTYFQDIEPQFRDNIIEKTEKLPLGLRVLLADMYLNLRGFLDPSRSARDISRFNIFMYQYVESIGYNKGISERKMRDIIKFFPEIDGKVATQYLLELGRVDDEIARLKESAAKSEANIAKRKEVIEKLKGLDKANK